MSKWIDGLSTLYVSGNGQHASNYVEAAAFASDGSSVANYAFYRSGYIGIAQNVLGGGQLYYIHLYKARNTWSNQVRDGFYYRFSRNDPPSKYNPSQYGTKLYRDFLNIPGQGTGRSTATTTAISSTTASTFGGMSADAIEGQASQSMLSTILSRQTYAVSDTYRNNEVRKALQEKGYSPTEIEAYLKARDDTERGFIRRVAEARIKAVLDRLFSGVSTGSSGGSGASSGGGSANGSNPAASSAPISFPDVQTKVVVRMPSGYLIPDQKQLKAITMPALHQTFIDPKGKVRSYTYVFDYIPQNIQYSSMGSEWVEIPRAENFAYVDWSRFQLMRVTMSWIVALDRTERGGAIVHDGMFRSVDSNITSLRRMSQRKYPVSIVNMDDLLSVQLKVDSSEGQLRSVKGMQFVITDLSVTASRRTSDPVTGQPSMPSKIAVAQCQMTLQEVPIESVQIVSLPKLEIPFTPPPGQSPSSNPLGPNYVLASSAAVSSPSTSWATTPPRGT